MIIQSGRKTVLHFSFHCFVEMLSAIDFEKAIMNFRRIVNQFQFIFDYTSRIEREKFNLSILAFSLIFFLFLFVIAWRYYLQYYTNIRTTIATIFILITFLYLSPIPISFSFFFQLPKAKVFYIFFGSSTLEISSKRKQMKWKNTFRFSDKFYWTFSRVHNLLVFE